MGNETKKRQFGVASRYVEAKSKFSDLYIKANLCF